MYHEEKIIKGAPLICVEPLFVNSRECRQATVAIQRAAVTNIVQRFFGSDARLKHREDGAPIVDFGTCHVPEWSADNSGAVGRWLISISHCRRAVAVAVMPTEGVAGARIGVDVEFDRLRAERVIRRVATAEELALVDNDALLLWSAKESVYKAFSDDVIRYSEQIKVVETVVKEAKSRLYFEVLLGGGEKVPCEVWGELKDGLLLTYTIYPTPHEPAHVAW